MLYNDFKYFSELTFLCIYYVFLEITPFILLTHQLWLLLRNSAARPFSLFHVWSHSFIGGEESVFRSVVGQDNARAKQSHVRHVVSRVCVCAKHPGFSSVYPVLQERDVNCRARGYSGPVFFYTLVFTIVRGTEQPRTCSGRSLQFFSCFHPRTFCIPVLKSDGPGSLLLSCAWSFIPTSFARRCHPCYYSRGYLCRMWYLSCLSKPIRSWVSRSCTSPCHSFSAHLNFRTIFIRGVHFAGRDFASRWWRNLQCRRFNSKSDGFTDAPPPIYQDCTQSLRGWPSSRCGRGDSESDGSPLSVTCFKERKPKTPPRFQGFLGRLPQGPAPFCLVVF